MIYQLQYLTIGVLQIFDIVMSISISETLQFLSGHRPALAVIIIGPVWHDEMRVDKFRSSGFFICNILCQLKNIVIKKEMVINNFLLQPLHPDFSRLNVCP